MVTFADIPKIYAGPDSGIYLQYLPYDGTSTWGKGADNSLPAFLAAARHLELFDFETGMEVYKNGIYLCPKLEIGQHVEEMVNLVYAEVNKLLNLNKLLTFLGGEHSISIGIIKAFSEKYPDMSVLHLDAHADLRSSFNGSQYNHACALYEAYKTINVVQVGIRSLDKTEHSLIDFNRLFLAQDMYNNSIWMQNSIDKLSDLVYITIDLDVFDPSIMPATGTPVPGEMEWYSIIQYLKLVFKQKNVIGFDIVELAPIKGLTHPDFLVAQLYYKMLCYKFINHGK